MELETLFPSPKAEEGGGLSQHFNNNLDDKDDSDKNGKKLDSNGKPGKKKGFTATKTNKESTAGIMGGKGLEKIRG